jgi:hypothetical protein
MDENLAKIKAYVAELKAIRNLKRICEERQQRIIEHGAMEP